MAETPSDSLTFGYADPPYIGQAEKHYSEDPACAEVDHVQLIRRLNKEFPSGWALSFSSVSFGQLVASVAVAHGLSLEDLLKDGLPPGYRVASWVKPFSSFKVNVNPAYAWEPVLFKGGRKRGRELPTIRDWVSENITTGRGTHGAKPRGFCIWVFQMLGARRGDQLVDLYPGSGAVMKAWGSYVSPVGVEVPA